MCQDMRNNVIPSPAAKSRPFPTGAAHRHLSRRAALCTGDTLRGVTPGARLGEQPEAGGTPASPPSPASHRSAAATVQKAEVGNAHRDEVPALETTAITRRLH